MTAKGDGLATISTPRRAGTRKQRIAPRGPSAERLFARPAKGASWHEKRLAFRTLLSFFAIGGCLAGGLPLDARAEDVPVAPLQLRHLSPLALLFGLPPTEAGLLVPTGRFEGRLLLEGANHFSVHEEAGEVLTLDGETYRATVSLRSGVADRLELGLDIPYLAHEKGVFDGFIEEFHEAFGLLDNSRGDSPSNELIYRYLRAGRTRFAMEEPVSGIGDLLVSGALQLWRQGEASSRAIALRSTLKLPTGDAGKLTGSGATDISLGLAGTDGALLAGWGMTLYGMAGGLYLGEGDLLADLQRRWATFGSFGIGWRAADWVTIKLQVDGHTALFKDSKFRPLDSWAAQLAGGVTFHLPAAIALDLALSENIFVETAPDVALHLALRKLF
jgi:hypothetical protein